MEGRRFDATLDFVILLSRGVTSPLRSKPVNERNGLISTVRQMHSVEKAAISHLERANHRVERAKEMVTLRIQVLRSRRKTLSQRASGV
jgi:hypothetical protein